MAPATLLPPGEREGHHGARRRQNDGHYSRSVHRRNGAGIELRYVPESHFGVKIGVVECFGRLARVHGKEALARVRLLEGERESARSGAEIGDAERLVVYSKVGSLSLDRLGTAKSITGHNPRNQ